MATPSTSVQVPHAPPPAHALPPPPEDDRPWQFERRRQRHKRVMAGFCLALLTSEALAYAGMLARRHAWFGARQPCVDRAQQTPSGALRR